MNVIVGRIWTPVFAQVSINKCTIKIKDGGSNEITIKIGEGNLTWTEARNIEYNLDRGSLNGATIREGDEIPVDVRLDATWEYVTGASASSSTLADPSPKDAIRGDGAAGDWVSSDADACQPYAVDIEILYEPTPSSCGDKETTTISDFRYESVDFDVRAGTISFNGKAAVVTPTSLREIQ